MDKTLKNIIYFLFAVLFVRFIGTFRSFFVAKLLLPSDYGVWITLLIIYAFAPIACLGTVETLLKQLPYYIGTRDREKAREIEGGVFTSIIISSSWVAILAFAFYPLFHRNYPRTSPLLFLMTITVSLSFFSAYFYHRFACYHNFKMVSFVDGFRGIITFILLVFSASKWGLLGISVAFFGAEILTLSFSAFLSIRFFGMVDLIFKRKILMDMVKIGFPITIIWWGFIIHTSIDRIISISLLGKEATGFYGLGVNVYNAIIIIPTVVGRVLYPKINQLIGEGVSRNKLIDYVIAPTQVLSMLIPVLIGVTFFLLPFLYEYFLPRYLPGLASAQILLVGSLFISLLRNGTNYLVSINRQRTLLYSLLISIVVNIIGNLALINLGYGIEGLAISTTLSSALLAALIWTSVFRNLEFTGYGLLKISLSLYLPFFLMLAFIGIFKFIVTATPNSSPLIPIYMVLLFLIAFPLTLFILPSTKVLMKGFFSQLILNVFKR